MMKNKRLPIILIFIFVIILIILFFNKVLFPKSDERVCITDSDCVIVAQKDPTNACCATCGLEAINKNAEVKRKLEQIKCIATMCTRWECSYPNKKPTAKCIKNSCEVIWIE